MGKKKREPVMDAQGSANFRQLPSVPLADELIDIAFRRASRANAGKGGKGELPKNRELARVGAAAKAIEARLHKVVRAFPSMERLHPFYRELVDVLVGVDDLKKSLGAIDWARKRVNDVRGETERKIRSSENPNEAMKARKAAYGRMASLVEQVGDDLQRLKQACIDLRHLPTLQFDRPVLVVAGFPNVGKSSYLRRISRAEPEVASYPFTTKGVNLGHVEMRHVLVQVMDTPGLLDRPLEDRNEIERQAIYALRHAADAVLFMLDPSGHCGYPIADQLHLLEEVRRDFPDLQLLVVENKADLKATGDHPAMSCETGEGVDAVTEEALATVWEVFEQRHDFGAGLQDEPGPDPSSWI